MLTRAALPLVFAAAAAIWQHFLDSLQTAR